MYRLYSTELVSLNFGSYTSFVKVQSNLALLTNSPTFTGVLVASGESVVEIVDNISGDFVRAVDSIELIGDVSVLDVVDALMVAMV